MIPPKKTAQQMFPLIELYLSSNLSHKDFCQQHGITESVLKYWLTRYRKQHASDQASSSFVEITPATASTEQMLLEIVYPGGVRLRFYSALSPEYLLRLLSFERP